MTREEATPGAVVVPTVGPNAGRVCVVTSQECAFLGCVWVRFASGLGVVAEVGSMRLATEEEK